MAKTVLLFLIALAYFILEAECKSRGGGGRSSSRSSFRSSFSTGYSYYYGSYFYYRNGAAGGVWWIAFVAVIFVLFVMIMIAYALTRCLGIQMKTALRMILCCKCRGYREYDNQVIKGPQLPPADPNASAS